ncbi:MAG: Holliday junction branch migration protein RuvA [Bacillota bacterium]
MQKFVCVKIDIGVDLMISFLKGKIVDKDLNYIILENNNIGYKIFTSQVTIDRYLGKEKDDQVIINTEMVVREDDISLFGFYTKDELKVFNLLRTVSRVGAKSSLKMLSTMNYKEIIRIIKNGDYKPLKKAKGVGTKTAKRIIIDLSKKMKEEFPEINNKIDKVPSSTINTEALEALIALGYSKKVSKKVLSNFDNSNLQVEEIIKKALKYF